MVSYNGNSLRCSLKIAVPKFSKYKERLLLILAKSLIFHCIYILLLLVDNNIFAHVTLVCVPSHSFVTILTN